ncbi:arginine--tRNA ligase [bacterium]|nr:arginine--tRNA ligase [bacterium]
MKTLLPNPSSEDDVRELVKTLEQKTPPSLESSERVLEKARTFFAVALSAILGEEEITGEQVQLNEVPAKHHGDYALQVPHLMRDMKRYRGEILPALKEHLDAQEGLPFHGFELVGPFLNFCIHRAPFIRQVLTEIQSQGRDYGRTTSHAGKRVIVEYSSPNMGKSLHVGHLGTTLVGQGLANIFEAAGALVFRVSHLGDWGTPCGMLQVGHELFAEDPDIQALRETPSQFYSTIYARFNEAQKDDPAIREKAKAAFAALERGEDDSLDFWRTVREESAEELDAIYSGMNIQFDTYLGEAFYEPYLEDTIDRLLRDELAAVDGEAVLVDLEEEGLKKVLLRKSDGATTYFARDVVALFKRKELFHYDLTAYVVGSEQTLHFRQLFAIGKKMGYLDDAACVHVPIGLITQKGAKISSRAGGALGAVELRDAIFERAKGQVDETLSELSEEARQKIADQLTNGALFYNQLLTAPGKSTDFNLESILDMKGKSGAYLQYACVRGKAILKKVSGDPIPLAEIEEEHFDAIDESALTLVKLSVLLPDIVDQSCTQRSPHPLAHYLHTVGQAINHFYQRVRIKDLEGAEKTLYLAILAGVVKTLERGLEILNIEVPDRM